MPKHSVTPFTYYTFRFDYDDDMLVDKIKSYVLREIPKYALFLEVSSDVKKKHIQGKLGKAISEEQLRKHFKKEFPNLFVKSNYSIKDIKEPEKYDSYICKDGNVLCNNIFNEQYILDQVALHKEKITEFETKAKKTIAPVTFTEKVFRDFVTQCPHDVTTIQLSYYDYKPTDAEKKRNEDACKVLLAYILKRLGKIAKVFDDNVLQRMYNGIKNSIIQLDDKSAEGFVKKLENRIVL